MNRVRLLSAAAGMAVTATVATWWLLDSTPPIATADRTAAASIPTPSTAPALDLSHPIFEPRTPTLPARARISTAPSKSAAPAAPAPDFRGRIVLIEPDGTEHSNAVGSLTCRRWIDLVPEALDVPIVAGGWVLPGDWLASAEALSFKAVHLGAQRAAIEEPIGLIPRPFKSELVVKARVVPGASLRIIAAETGLDLRRVTLLSANPLADNERHPGVGYEPRILASELRSPIVLEEPLFPRARFGGSRRAELLVGAPDYSWREVDVDLSAGGEQTVALQKAAELALLVRGFDPQSGARLRLRESEGDFGEPIVDTALHSDGLVLLGGLPPGACRAAAEFGEADEPTIVLGLVPLTLRAGKRTEATLDVGASPVGRLANARGVVLVPEAWGSDGLVVQLDLLDEPIGDFVGARTVHCARSPSPLGNLDAFAWSADDLQVGSYQLRVSEPPFGVAITLPPGGRDDIEVRIPPPAELVVRVVEDPSGAAVDPDGVAWTRGGHEHQVGGRAERTGFGVFKLRAPVGPIGLFVRSSAHALHVDGVDLVPGMAEHTVHLERVCGVVLRLLDGALPVAFPESEDVHAWTEDGGGIGIHSSGGQFERRIRMTTPGKYTIHVPGVPGFEPVPNQQVEVLAGTFTEHVVQLVRKR